MRICLTVGILFAIALASQLILWRLRLPPYRYQMKILLLIFVLLFFVWLLVRSPETETLTLRSDGTRRYMVDAAGHRLTANRYTQALDVGQSARCKVRHFPILMAPVIESCRPEPRRAH